VFLDPGAVELRRQDGTLVDARVSISPAGGETVAVLTFEGPEFVGGSLADGRYTLAVFADRVHDRWGRELDRDGAGSAGGDRVEGFFRLFGDTFRRTRSGSGAAGPLAGSRAPPPRARRRTRG